eukprot:TRINITY_DN264_c0_g1_i1.p1 TRINITY_DN264_c0_g1~~TRINITY_DN264_c0_g1_i1.p1  ORF type:complete len:688 (-),score=144.82 TRINITY_DN264_c0_g1_i1:27-2090(-)
MSHGSNGITTPDGQYTRTDTIVGKGASKTVYLGLDHHMGLQIAWNEILLGKDVDLDLLDQEIDILSKVDHLNIINFHNSFTNKEERIAVIITELMIPGTLTEFAKIMGHFTLGVMKNWCIQILHGLAYLHGHDPPLIHRDLKCDNIFINGSTGVVKIGDLGLCTVLDGKPLHSFVGTPDFMAPEFFDDDGNGYNEKVDIWAFGMCVLELLIKETPYQLECTRTAQVFNKLIKKTIPISIGKIKDPEVRNFILLCLTTDSSERPSVNQLLDHPFLTTKDNSKSRVEVYTDTEFYNILKDSGSQIPPSLIERVNAVNRIENESTKTPISTSWVNLGSSNDEMTKVEKFEAALQDFGEKQELARTDSHYYDQMNLEETHVILPSQMNIHYGYTTFDDSQSVELEDQPFFDVIEPHPEEIDPDTKRNSKPKKELERKPSVGTLIDIKQNNTIGTSSQVVNHKLFNIMESNERTIPVNNSGNNSIGNLIEIPNNNSIGNNVDHATTFPNHGSGSGHFSAPNNQDSVNNIDLLLQGGNDRPNNNSVPLNLSQEDTNNHVVIPSSLIGIIENNNDTNQNNSLKDHSLKKNDSGNNSIGNLIEIPNNNSVLNDSNDGNNNSLIDIRSSNNDRTPVSISIPAVTPLPILSPGLDPMTNPFLSQESEDNVLVDINPWDGIERDSSFHNSAPNLLIDI